ncbi:MAG: O-antigen ligase family protein [Elusimicrobiales bacterium]|jgi:putative inorganic carbon (HCO3(-)) transporter|nr:O-antigen ligase family protein [Elusimicrobiales bacterium]
MITGDKADGLARGSGHRQRTSPPCSGRSEALIPGLLTLVFFVSPLLFFTDLTRNPYYLQIALLNVSLSAALLAALWAMRARGSWDFPRNALWTPLALFAAVLLVSWARSWAAHEPFFRPAIFSEGLRAFLFLFVNCGLAFWLSARAEWKESPAARPMTPLLLLLMAWGAAWLFFPYLRSQPSGPGLWQRFWDPYGAMVWAAGVFIAWRSVREGRQEDYLNLALVAGALASVYGVLQYFGVELVWLKTLNPYGNRSVSTFGNPNFISSYVVTLAPLALACWLDARTAPSRFFYAAVFLSYEAMLLASLTRSSWLGMAAGLGFLALLPDYREKFRAAGRRALLLGGLALALAALWPVSASSPPGTGVAQRLSEAAGKISSSGTLTIAADADKVYPSLHQRVLIWTSAWQMGLESPLLGKGWGAFELFYPFYQGPLLSAYEGIRGLRTHANNAHNEVLELWSQAGLAGLAAFALVLAALARAFTHNRKAGDGESRFWAAALAAGVVGMLADNMLNVSVHFAVPGFMFWWVMGALSARLGSPAPVFSGLFSGYKAWAPAALLALLAVSSAAYWQGQFRREALYFSGFKLMRKGDFRAAAAELKRAHSAWPREVNTNYELGNAYVRSGDMESAVWAYGEALRANCGYDEIFFNLAVVEKRLGDLRSAINSLKVSALINPLNVQTYQAAAEIYVKDPRAYADEAARMMAGASRVLPGDASLKNTLGYFHGIRGDLAAAAEAYGRAVRLDPANRIFEDNLRGVVAAGKLYGNPHIAWLEAYRGTERRLAAGDAAGALRLAERLFDGGGGEAQSRYLRSKIFFASGEVGKAREELLAVLREDPGHGEALYGLATVLERSGDVAGAVRHWSLLLEREPGNARAAARLEALRSRGGQ